MPAALRCPGCKKAFLIEKSEEDRTLKCRVCGEIVEFRGRPDGDRKLPKIEPKKKRFDFKELPGWAAGLLTAGVLGVLACLASLGMQQLHEPHDRLHAALKEEYDALADLVEGLHVAEEATAAEPQMAAHVAEIRRLLADPRPFGRGRKAVGAALLRQHAGSLEGRMKGLRDAKSDAFDRQGVSSIVSKALRDVPASIHDLETAFK